MSSGFIRERILILSISFLELGEVVNLSSFNFLLSTSGNNIWNPAEMVCWVAEICWRKCYTVRVTFRSHISNVCLISSVQNSPPPSSQSCWLFPPEVYTYFKNFRRVTIMSHTCLFTTCTSSILILFLNIIY